MPGLPEFHSLFYTIKINLHSIYSINVHTNYYLKKYLFTQFYLVENTDFFFFLYIYILTGPEFNKNIAYTTAINKTIFNAIYSKKLPETTVLHATTTTKYVYYLHLNTWMTWV